MSILYKNSGRESGDLGMPQSPEALRLSVIITALNEEAGIEAAVRGVLDAFSRFRISGEAVVIDDGSSDGTGRIVRRLAEEDARVRPLVHCSPLGVGASFWHGVEAARGVAVMWFPGDNENNPREMLRYHWLLEHVDIVIPFIYNPQSRPLLRNILSFIYRSIVNATFLTHFHYTNGTSLYRRSLLRGLPGRSGGFFFQTDIIVRLARAGYLFAEVPCRLGARSAGPSKAVSLASFLRVAMDYLRLVRDIYLRGRAGAAVYPEGSATRIRRRAGGSAPGG